METVTLEIRDGLPVFSLEKFQVRLADALPLLIKCIHSKELREHPIWGQLIPYDTAYNTGISVGHSIRPDILFTSEGPKVCEFDFVPAGRGFCLAAIPDAMRRAKYLATFARWYRNLGVEPVMYATSTYGTVQYWLEVQEFARALRKAEGIEITPVDVQTTDVHGGLVDRLFYKYEVGPQRTVAGEIMTKEAYLDSKVVFALIHDLTMETWLRGVLGAENLGFLKEIIPETYMLSRVCEDQQFFREVSRNRRDWVIKNGDVEVPGSWGSRGVIVGAKQGRNSWEASLNGERNPHKSVGYHPILQRFYTSMDFSPFWNAIVDGEISQSKSELFGKSTSPKTTQYASQRVFARIGMYFLVENRECRVFVPPMGVITLRQDSLCHGASDALFTAIDLS